jgi:hypothetical protein
MLRLRGSDCPKVAGLSVACSGAKCTVKSAVLFDAPSSIGTVVSTRIALTNSRLACGLPLTSTRMTAPFFCASVPCQAVVIHSNKRRGRRDEVAIAIGSNRTPERCFSRK